MTSNAAFLDEKNGVGIRLARPDDHAALLRICLLTADNGADASAKEDDGDLVGLIYAVPYQVLCPDFAFVLEDEEGVCGYVVGTPDTEAFGRRIADTWFPPIAARLADPGPDEGSWTGSDWARHHIHHPPNLVHPALADYPAHGHIDLLPRAQKKGLGRLALTTLMTCLAGADNMGLHLGVSPGNLNAQGFYQKLGFARITGPGTPPGSLYMVRKLGDFV